MIGFFNAFNMMVIPDLKNAKSLSKEMIKQKEGESILSQIVDYDDVVLLDEKERNLRRWNLLLISRRRW